MRPFRIILLFIWSLFVAPLQALPHFSIADSSILAAIADTIIPGAVLCVIDNQEIVYLQAYGNRCIYPEQEPMTTNTIFDLASVSKPLGAGTAMLLLCAEEKANVNHLVHQYILMVNMSMIRYILFIHR